MSYFRKLDNKLLELQRLFKRNERWLIMFVGDPDALASGLALKRIMARKVESVCLAMANEISRPDNLAMIRYLHIPV
ncbi:MAG: phosphoesterase, partial [Desulfohalobiaceae bacterium]